MKNANIFQSKGLLLNAESGLVITELEILKAKHTVKNDEVVIHAITNKESLDTLSANKHILSHKVLRNMTALKVLVEITYSNKNGNGDVTLFATNSFPPIIKGSDNFLLKDHITLHKDDNETHQLKVTDMIVFKEYQMLDNPNVTVYWFYTPKENEGEMIKQIELISSFSSLPDLQNKIVNAGVYTVDNTVQLFTIEVETQKGK